MTLDTENKFIPIEIKDIDKETGSFEGYASKFGKIDQGGDRILKGAYSKSLKNSERKVKMLWQHDPSQPIGIWDEIKEDDIGLHVKGRLLLTISKAQETYELIKAGVIEGMSIGYRTVKAHKDKGVRELSELDLWEISLVTFPMQKEAQLTGFKGEWTKKGAERVLRDAGMPNAMATKLIAGGWNAADTIGQGDPDDGLSGLAQKLREMDEKLKRST